LLLVWILDAMVYNTILYEFDLIDIYVARCTLDTCIVLYCIGDCGNVLVLVPLRTY